MRKTRNSLKYFRYPCPLEQFYLYGLIYIFCVHNFVDIFLEKWFFFVCSFSYFCSPFNFLNLSTMKKVIISLGDDAEKRINQSFTVIKTVSKKTGDFCFVSFMEPVGDSYPVFYDSLSDAISDILSSLVDLI